MREMTLRDIQLVSLDLLKEIHEFCTRNELKYFLAYGTLLGAVRHKGFIPWDDDIDIVMPRPDYERFIATFVSTDKTRLFTCHNSKSMIPYARVCDMERTQVVFDEKPWTKTPTGIYVDIFPLDAAEAEGFEEKKPKAMKLWRKSWAMRMSLSPFRKQKGLSKRVKWITRSTISSLMWKKRINKHIKLCTGTPWKSTHYLCQLACPDPHEGLLRSEWYDEQVLLPFEDGEFAAPKKWDEVLSSAFGDYMQLPPIEDRVPHTSYARFYWKE